jgi:hypothetical protein
MRECQATFIWIETGMYYLLRHVLLWFGILLQPLYCGNTRKHANYITILPMKVWIIKVIDVQHLFSVHVDILNKAVVVRSRVGLCLYWQILLPQPDSSIERCLWLDLQGLSP